MRAPVTTRCDAVVIGAGVIGAAVALELARGGRDVVCVDKGPGAGTGSTSASSSIIRFGYSTVDAVLTAWESAACWRDWSGFLGVDDPDGMATFVPTGNLVYRTPDHDGAAVTAAWDDVGIPYELLDAAALRSRFPALDHGRFFPPKRVDDPAFADAPSGELDALYNADAGYIDDPMLAARNLAHAARHHGATFRFRAEVRAVRRTGGRVEGVELADGDVLDAPVVVNAAGPHSAGLNALAGVTADMRITTAALRQEVYAVPAPPGLLLADGAPFVADLDLGQYFRPQAGGTLLAGGTEAACDDLEWIADPDSFDDVASVDGWERTVLRLARRVPDLGIPLRPVGLAALYDVTEDWVPIYDRSSLDGWFLACGTSGNQFKNAPLAGQFLRALVDAAAAGVDHDAEPVRFRGPVTGRLIDLGAFSRRRAPTATSGTVMG